MDFARLSKEQRRSLERATKNYEESLEGDPLTWLEERGITEKVARTFRLGLVEEPEIGHEQAKGRLAIPYLTPKGVVSIRFRTLDEDEEPKYWQPSGSPTHLFNVQDLHGSHEHIAITEGELDSLVLSALCDVPAVGIPGATNWKPHWRRIFYDYAEVFIVMDGDKAGRAAANKLKEHLPNGVVIDIGEGLDINDAYLEEGADYVRGRLGLE